MSAARVVLRGRVQGVGFRWFAQGRAEALGLRGWVRNLRDGAVEAELHGESEAVERCIAALRAGPPSGEVREVELEWLADPPAAPGGFAIRPTA